MMEERTGEAFEFDECLTVVGSKLQPGKTAPDFDLDSFNPDTSHMESVRLSDSVGKVRILNVINSLDTPVCHTETRYWEGVIRDLPPTVTVYTVSMDLPFAQARWRTSEGTTHQALSSHRSERFGVDYGVLIKEWRLLQRAVFVIDSNDRVAHVEYVNDQMQEPDYSAAISVACQAASV